MIALMAAAVDSFGIISTETLIKIEETIWHNGRRFCIYGERLRLEVPPIPRWRLQQSTSMDAFFVMKATAGSA